MTRLPSILSNSNEQWIRAGWLVDGQGGPYRPDMVIGIRNGLIVHVGPFNPDCPISCDFSHATVLPALLDAHVHLVFSGTTDGQIRSRQLKFDPDQIPPVITQHLNEYRRHGIVAVRDGGDRHGAVLQYQTSCPLDTYPPVRVAVTSWAWHAKGRYGSMVGRYPREGSSLPDAVQDRIEAVDHVKIIQSGLNSIERFRHQGGPQFSREELEETVNTAHAFGKPVMVHANGETAVRMAIEAGCDSIEHGYFMGEDNIKRMADTGTHWVPTVIPMVALSRADSLTPTQKEVARRTVEHQLSQIRQAHAQGVTITLGTDAGSFGVDHGISVHQELALFIRAGLTLEYAIQTATQNSALLLGLDHQGALMPGKRAEMIIVPGPPEQLPESLKNIEALVV